MEISMEMSAGPKGQQALAQIGFELQTLAAGLDVHFIGAGTTLANSYQMVEHLISALENVTGAINRDAAEAAMETMRETADRLTQLPMDQGSRQQSLDNISAASTDLLHNLKQIRRTLSFLQICGLNIKVTAAGAEGFADFADHMSAKLEQAEQQVDEFEEEIAQLGGKITEMVQADRQLMGECATVIPRVPLKLSQNAQTLQKLQQENAALAEHTAQLARDVRSKLAAAIGALQVGDMTRQRLEHITQAIELLLAGPADEAAEAGHSPRAIKHVTALLAAQLTDAVDQFLRETGTLVASLRGIVPDAMRLADMQQGGGSEAIHQILHHLENDIGEIANVTRQLYAAEANSGKLGQATSQAADSLRGRLKAVNHIQKDVEQMAWNTALQCRALGADGRGIAVISEEIQAFSRRLADIWEQVTRNFARVESLATSFGDVPHSAGETDTADHLVTSLETVRGGNDLMAESMKAVDKDALEMGAMLRSLTEDLAVDVQLGPELSQMAATFSDLIGEPADHDEALEWSEEERQSLTALFARISALYTMASERDIHRAYLTAHDAGLQAESAAQGGDDGLFDDGLFGDADFDDGLF